MDLLKSVGVKMSESFAQVFLVLGHGFCSGRFGLRNLKQLFRIRQFLLLADILDGLYGCGDCGRNNSSLSYLDLRRFDLFPFLVGLALCVLQRFFHLGVGFLGLDNFGVGHMQLFL